MIVTKEEQEKLVDKYVKSKKTTSECVGFIDGIIAALDLVDKKMRSDLLKNDTNKIQ